MSNLTKFKVEGVHANSKTKAFIAAGLFIASGSVLSLIGLVVGILVGMTYCDNSVCSNYGGDLGYEGAGMLVGLVGSAVLSFPVIFLWFRGSRVNKSLAITYVICWLIEVIVQHLISSAISDFSFALIFAPIIITGISSVFFLWPSE
jgi:hypothetical protein